MVDFRMITEFEKKLGKLGLSYQGYPDNSYLFLHDGNAGQTIKVKLICSAQADYLKYGSRNGNIIESMGIFKFTLLCTETDTDYFILALKGTTYQRTDFVFVPTEELNRRFIKKNRKPTANNRISIVFWLMDDRFLYNCTGIGVEWEWYFLSRGVNGRMIDGSEWDYSEFLNDWNRLTMK